MTGLTLSAVELDTLLIIQELAETYGYGPSLQEIAHELGLRSRGNAHAVVDGLVAVGCVDRLPGKARGLSVLTPLPRPEETDIELTPAGLAYSAAASAADQ